jgi:hypothetical protein
VIALTSVRPRELHTVRVGLEALDQIARPHTAALLHRHYATEWADWTNQRLAISGLAASAAPGFRWILAARHPRLVVEIAEIAAFGEAISRDFSTYRLAPTKAEEIVSGLVLVRGWVLARTVHTREGLRRPFADAWQIGEDGVTVLESR